jgi:hypothetical protein
MKYQIALLLILNGFTLQAQNKGFNIITDTTVAYNENLSALGNKRQIDVFYNWYYPGKNIAVQYIHYWGRHALTGGIKYHINGKDNLTNYAFKNKFYADPVIEHIGVSIGYQFDFKRPASTQKSAVNPFLFASI